MLFHLVTASVAVLEIKSEVGQSFFNDEIFYRLLHCCAINNVWESWPMKINFDRPNAKIGQKIGDGQLLFLALVLFQYTFTK